MRQTVGNLIEKMLNRPKNAEPIEFLTDEMSLQVRGGDREYTPMYDDKSKDIDWGRAAILLDNLK
ncbi:MULTISPECIES: hypothetical protein [unclassified Arcicella]|uniref:hypothetical protein n=1 Tax=unclassified Arcicella TaxID=2644986 RepID=UPI00285F6666|nr:MULTISPECIES: hypothetical protein [unclassified Arcicella]MDR6562158.1 hypothetical protein [Arcicella sp. BE51]MDR6812147.1 hypothetical protein [Arcicella sp. BE140]MDR6823459.1 hypothetical protein [Arcicella sp. BE139]